MTENKPEQNEKPSVKREVTATVVTTVVVVALTLGANALIGKFGQQVRNRISPQNDEQN